MTNKLFLCKWPAPGHEVTLVYAANEDAAKHSLNKKCRARNMTVGQLKVRQLDKTFALEFRLDTPEQLDSGEVSPEDLRKQLEACELLLKDGDGRGIPAPAISLCLQSGHQHDTYGPGPDGSALGWALQEAVTEWFLPNVHSELVNWRKVNSEEGGGIGAETAARRAVYEAACAYTPVGPLPTLTDASGTSYNDGNTPGGGPSAAHGSHHADCSTPCSSKSHRSGSQSARAASSQPSEPRMNTGARHTPATPAPQEGASNPGNSKPTRSTCPSSRAAGDVSPNKEALGDVKKDLGTALQAAATSGRRTASTPSGPSSSQASNPFPVARGRRPAPGKVAGATSVSDDSEEEVSSSSRKPSVTSRTQHTISRTVPNNLAAAAAVVIPDSDSPDEELPLTSNKAKAGSRQQSKGN